MTLALSLFVLFYILMLAVQQYRPWVALGGAGAFLLLGKLGVYDFTLADAARAVDFNVLLMMAGMMGTVFLFIQSKMPARLAEELIAHVPDVRWAVSVLALLAGFISAFVDNVATVLMVAPVGLAIARRLKRSPVPVLIAIAVSSNLQGAATLVGDTTSILLGGFAGMNFFDFFWMEGRPGIFWSVELGALASLGVLFWLFRDQRQPVHVTVETEVEDDVPTALLLLTVGLLIAASFLPEPSGGVLHLLYTLRSGLVCMGLCLFGAARACWRSRSLRPLAETFRALDYDTLLLLFSLFILLEGVSRAGVIDAAAHLFRRNTEVFQRESHVFLYHRGDDLVVRALEHHAHGLADVIELVIIGGVHALDVHLALLRQEDGVEVLGKGGFAAAVCAQHGHELAPPDLHGDAVERIAGLLRVVAEL